MFTGIVQYSTKVEEIKREENSMQLAIRLQEKPKHGASVAVNGVCLTVTDSDQSVIRFDVMGETLSKTNLQFLKVGDRVNIEHAAKIGEEIGGHLLSGHVFGLAEIIQIETTANNTVMTFQCPKEWMKYILEKGFIALNGVSLTLTEVNPSAGTFRVWFIPETQQQTTFGQSKVGDKVNVEIDTMTQVIVETVEKIMKKN